MPGKLFVGNLSFNVADAELSELCASLNVAAENVKVMRDMDTGRSRGFAFIELKQDADLAGAISLLNGKMLDGRALTVSEARPQKKREFGSGGPSFGHRPGGGGFGRKSGGGGGNSRGRDRDRPRRRTEELY